MKKIYAILFLGFLVTIMGLNNDETPLVNNNLKLIIGIMILIYGSYLYYTIDKSTITNIDKTKKNIQTSHKNKSYLFLIVGVILLRSIKWINKNNPSDLNILKFILLAIGIVAVIYGLILFFKEKKESIE